MVKSLCWHVPQKKTLDVCRFIPHLSWWNHGFSSEKKKKKHHFSRWNPNFFSGWICFMVFFLLKAKVHFFVAWIIAILEANPNLFCLNPLFICRQNHLLFLFTSTVLAVNNLSFAIIQFHFPTKKNIFSRQSRHVIACVARTSSSLRLRCSCHQARQGWVSWLMAVGCWGLMGVNVVEGWWRYPM